MEQPISETSVDIVPDTVAQQTYNEAIQPGNDLTQVGSGLSAMGKPLQSTNFVENASGWRLNSNGKAELQFLQVGNEDNYVSFDGTSLSGIGTLTTVARLPAYQSINGTNPPVPVFIEDDGTVLVADANDSDADDFDGFFYVDGSSQLPATVLGSSKGNTSYSHTVQAGTDRLLLVFSFAWNGAGAPTNATAGTWNGQSLTLHSTTAVGTTSLKTWYLVLGDATTSTAATLAMTGSSADDVDVMAVNIGYVSQSSPIDASNTYSAAATNTFVDISVTQTQSYALSIGCFANAGNVPTVSAPLAQLQQESNHPMTVGYSVYKGTSAHTLSATHTTSIDRLASALVIKNANAEVFPVALAGLISGFTGLTIGSIYYVSNTEGQISTTPGSTSLPVGKAVSATQILIQ